MTKKLNILVSGGNGLIGYSLCEFLLEEGHNVLVGDINLSKFKKKNKLFKNLYLLKVDLTKEKNFVKLLNFAKLKFDKIDSFINCSYPKTRDWGKGLLHLEQESLNNNLKNQLGSLLIFLKHLSKYFLKQKSGNIILFSSIYGFATPNFNDYTNKIYSPIEYGAIKAGVISITKYLSKYFRNKGIRVNCISPGGIEDGQEKKFKNNYKKHCNSKGLLDPNDLRFLVKFLLDEKSKYINGQNLIIDDGWSL